MITGDHGIGELQIRSQLVWVSCPPRMVARRLNASAGSASLVFEPDNVVALPTMNRNRNSLQSINSDFGINTPICELRLGAFVAHLPASY